MFGCIIYVKMPKKQRKKLDEKGVKCFFTRYSLESMAYKLYHIINKKIIISRDVDFLKNKSWHGLVDESSSPSSKVPNIEEKEDDIGDQQEDGVENIDCRQRQKGKQHLTCRPIAPSTSRQPELV